MQKAVTFADGAVADGAAADGYVADGYGQADRRTDFTTRRF
jgi:hypothetical protein